MSEIRALDKLREEIKTRLDGWAKIDFMKLVDEIQAEIDERFMELPVGADGVPWTLETESFVDDTGAKVVFSGLEVDYAGRWRIRSNCVLHDPSLCRHVKPDPLKELLEDFAKDYLAFYHDNYMNYDGTDTHVIEKHAKRIRELLGCDTE